MIYNLYKTNIDNKKLLKKSLFNIVKSVKEFLKELIIFVITFNSLIAMKKKYEKNDIV